MQIFYSLIVRRVRYGKPGIPIQIPVRITQIDTSDNKYSGKADNGAACGLDVGCTAVAIVKVGKGKELVGDLAGQIKALRG